MIYGWQAWHTHCAVVHSQFEGLAWRALRVRHQASAETLSSPAPPVQSFCRPQSVHSATLQSTHWFAWSHNHLKCKILRHYAEHWNCHVWRCIKVHIASWVCWVTFRQVLVMPHCHLAVQIDAPLDNSQDKSTSTSHSLRRMAVNIKSLNWACSTCILETIHINARL